MALPDRDVAMTWGDKLLVDRDGIPIGPCTQVFTDDATGRPEWATALLGGENVFVPLLNAVDAGREVRLSVRRAAVVTAPPVGTPEHVSEDEEAQLYQHYGIEYSRAHSATLLPRGESAKQPVPKKPRSARGAPAGGAGQGGGLRSAVAGLAGLANGGGRRTAALAGSVVAASTALVALVLALRRLSASRAGRRGSR
jgi:hypothetical protein